MRNPPPPRIDPGRVEDLRRLVDANPKLYWDVTSKVARKLANAKAKGDYSRAEATKGFARLVDAAARLYQREHPAEHATFSAPTRAAMVEYLVARFDEEWKRGGLRSYLDARGQGELAVHPERARAVGRARARKSFVIPRSGSVEIVWETQDREGLAREREVVPAGQARARIAAIEEDFARVVSVRKAPSKAGAINQIETYMDLYDRPAMLRIDAALAKGAIDRAEAVRRYRKLVDAAARSERSSLPPLAASTRNELARSWVAEAIRDQRKARSRRR
jgi:hypothetical protein